MVTFIGFWESLKRFRRTLCRREVIRVTITDAFVEIPRNIVGGQTLNVVEDCYRSAIHVSYLIQLEIYLPTLFVTHFLYIGMHSFS